MKSSKSFGAFAANKVAEAILPVMFCIALFVGGLSSLLFLYGYLEKVIGHEVCVRMSFEEFIVANICSLVLGGMLIVMGIQELKKDGKWFALFGMLCLIGTPTISIWFPGSFLEAFQFVY